MGVRKVRGFTSSRVRGVREWREDFIFRGEKVRVE
jgi:hypothetical protein